MKNRIFNILTLICLILSLSCSQNKATIETKKAEKPIQKEKILEKIQEQEPHEYGGWYCPDNLRGFPAVDIKDWKNVPVVNGRLATEKETKNGTSLIFIDTEKYPNAKPLDIKMPKLAQYYNNYTKKDETVIVIQAIKVAKDSIVGFRYLNGGNGSARLNEVKFLSDNDIKDMTFSQFVSLNILIDATHDEIWNVLTKPEYGKLLQPVFDKENTLKADWQKTSKVNFKYRNAGLVTSEFAEKLFGNYYIQVDCEFGNYQYVEKFLLFENKEAKKEELHIVCGPYYDTDFEKQKTILNNWVQQVKFLSERHSTLRLR
jgi:hypothetical protein